MVNCFTVSPFRALFPIQVFEQATKTYFLLLPIPFPQSQQTDRSMDSDPATRTQAAFGPAKWQEPCYYYPKDRPRSRDHGLYEMYTENLAAMPSCHPRHQTAPPSLVLSTPEVRGRSRYRIRGSSKNRDETPEWRIANLMHRKRLQYTDTVMHMQMISMDTVNQEALSLESSRTRGAGSVLYALGWLLLRCLQFAYECVLLLGLSIILGTLRAVTRHPDDSEDRGGIARTEVATKDTTVVRMVPPLVGCSGEGWPKLYERLDLDNAKKTPEETCSEHRDRITRDCEPGQNRT